MTRSLAQQNRFFVSPDFSVHYRKTKQLNWQNPASSGYALLTTLEGQLDYEVDGQPATLAKSESVVLEPNTSISARGQKVELIFLNVSASLMIQHAAAMHLIPPKSIVSFTREHVRGDQTTRRVAGAVHK